MAEAVKLNPIPMDKVGLEAAPEVKDSQGVVKMAQDTKITTAAEYEMAVSMIAQIKMQGEKVTELRDRWVKPLRDVIKDITATFKPALDNLARAEKVLKTGAVSFADSSARERIELINQAGDQAMEGDPSQAETLLEKAEALETPTVAGVSLRESWTGEVVDMQLIPDDYLIADIKALKATTKKLKEKTVIPGWKAYPTHSMAITTSKFQEKK